MAALERNESDNWASYSFWSKKNSLDASVKVPTITGKVGDTVNLNYEIVNHGPADGVGPA